MTHRRMSPMLLGLAAVLLVLSACSGKKTESTRTVRPWTEKEVEIFEKLAVQAFGRVKPLNTFARWAMLRENGSRRLKVKVGDDDETLKPVPWIMDAIFWPDEARKYDTFLLSNDEVATAIGISTEGKKKRDRYSYDDLAPGRAKLMTLARDFLSIPEKERDAVQKEIVELTHALREYEGFLAYAAFARQDVRVPPDAALRSVFGGRERVSFAEAFRGVPHVHELVEGESDAMREAGGGLTQAASRLFNALLKAAQGSRVLALFPLSKQQVAHLATRQEEGQDLDRNAEEWLSPWDVVGLAIHRPDIPPSEDHFAMIESLQGMARAPESAAAFTASAKTFAEKNRSLAEAHQAYDKIEPEVFLYTFSPFHWANGFFFMAFAAVAVVWLVPNKWLWRLVWTLLIAATAFLIFGIVIRSHLRGRPPVTSLYETVPFITAFVVLALMVLEKINKQKIALSMAPALGVLGLLIAFGYENGQKQDTIGKLVAVLDTNFWLTTHVICIVIGYAAALLTAAIGHVYVFGRMGDWAARTWFGRGGVSQESFRNIGRMMYGALAFSIIFSTVGTILGGVWANDSWGRFWGWDPKENGALMIVLWSLAMVHGRLGGYIKTWGLAITSIILGMIVAFSWWGVNNLGIGLHSYGFASGVMQKLFLFYYIELGVIALASIWYFFLRPSTPAKRAAA